MAMQQMSSAFASSSKSSSSSVVSLKKYDVFLSFRGEDTRRNFTSHLYEALSQKKVKTFKDDHGLEKGDEISPALIKAIEESHASIVIFSENYASSKWCLDELNKILECKKDQEQEHIVIPVFYNIDPSHVRKQNGSYKQAFAKHEQDTKLNKDKLHKWKAALTEAANLVGWDSRNRIESDLIKDIVKDVLQKLNLRYPYEVKGLVGIEKMYQQIESLLKIGSNNARFLGIWGMGGIGKTTLATVLYAKLCSQFEGHCFLTNVRKESKKYGLDVVRNKLFCALLKEEDLRLDAPGVETPFLMKRLERKKVFVVLDDVSTSEQIEDLIIKNNWLGPGSRVIVTTRDKHILSQVDECEIYEVKELNKHDSLQLFCLTTFKEMHPIIGYEDLSTSVIAHCKGNPLALKVLGANLCFKKKEVWESELKKLQNVPNVKIHDVLKLSYDDLDRVQKEVFLDIACFLNGWARGRVTSLLEACNLYPVSGIEVLLDKALITISNVDTIEMHDLIQEMGREIVNQGSEDPGRRSRLWKPEEVYDVLKNNEGTKIVKGISFDSSKGGDLYLSSNSFKRMTNLRYLEIYKLPYGNRYNVYFPDCPGQLSDKLRYLRLDACCLKSLPSTFRAEMLVELSIRTSKLKKLWDGVQNLVNLKKIDLSYSKDLTDVPDLSMALNLERVFLGDCESLRQLHPSVLPLPKLTRLYLKGCKKLESLKTSIHSKSLRQLFLNNCSSLTEFSVTSEEMTNLYLGGTAIRELSSSIWRNSKLRVLGLNGCYKLDIVGSKLSNDPGLGSLTALHLSRSTQINASNLRFILDGILSLKRLNLSECCNLEALPDNIQNHSRLERLRLDDCRKLVSLPELPPSLKLLGAANCTSLDRDSTQRLLVVLGNMLQSIYSNVPEQYPSPEVLPIDAFFFLPGAQVPGKFGFYTTTEDSISIPPIPKSGLCGFIFCIILSEGKHSYSKSIFYHTYEDGEEVDGGYIVHEGGRTLISNHMLLCWCGYNEQESGGDHYNLSFKFEHHFGREEGTVIRYSKEGVKGCGVFPVYASPKLDVSGSVEIVELESNAQISHQSLTLDNDEPQCRGGVEGSNNEEDEDDQQQLLIPAHKKRRT